MLGKGKQIRLNTKDKKKEPEHFVQKPNQHFIIESRSNYSFYEWIIESTKQIIFPFMNLLVH